MSYLHGPSALPESPAAEPLETQPFNLLEHLATQEINPQTGSPLYNCIPPEVRVLIFQYALTGSANLRQPSDFDFRVRHDHDPEDPPAVPSDSMIPRTQIYRSRHRWPKDGFDWHRPDSVDAISIALLQTCRGVYVETHSLPQLQKEHVFYRYRGLDWSGSGSRQNAIHHYFGHVLDSPAPVAGVSRRDLVRSVRIFTQMHWLDDTDDQWAFWRLVTETPWLKPVENLRFTIRRGDWWDWERNDPLKINPFRGKVDNVHQTHLDMQTGDGNPAFQSPVWGLAFKNLPNLKTLTIEFETAEDKKQELEDIVAWAAKWRLPLANGRHLSAAGQPIGKMSYRGKPYHWSDRCSMCSRSHMDPQCELCGTRCQLVRLDYGPRLYHWSVTWVAVSDEAARQSV
jgi:hypothetical protein